MNRPRPGERRPADAALQLDLPLLDRTATRPPARPGAGRPQHEMIRLGEQWVSYQLKRTSRRTIGFLIDERGLTITAPRWVSRPAIDEAVLGKSDWIQRKLEEWQEHSQRCQRSAIRWCDGNELPFLGEQLEMRSHVARRAVVTREARTLRIGLPDAGDSEQFRHAVQHWVRDEARPLFAERLAHFGQLLGRGPSTWALSSARTRWGSCNAEGAIRLNWRLMYCPRPIIDYVVAHEVAHLEELNHGPRFWSLVGRLFPEYEDARQWLRSYPDQLTLA